MRTFGAWGEGAVRACVHRRCFILFFFVLFENIGERARMSAVNKSPAVSVLFYRPRSTDFEEKIEGL